MKAITAQQIIIIHTLLPAAVKADKEIKQALIAQYTGSNDKGSTQDLTYSQAQSLIERLQGTQCPASDSQRADTMRKKIISMAHDLGWQHYDDNRHKLVADMKAINCWCLKYGYLHKPLNGYTYAELPALVTQFERLYHSHLIKK